MWTIGYYFARIRILPLTIASLFLLLSAKVYDVVETGNQISQLILGGQAYAETEKPDAKTSKNEKESKRATDAEASDDTTNQKESASEKVKPNADTPITTKEKIEFSDVELDVLQSLAKRREKLDVLEKEIRLKESLLDAGEVKLDEKITQIKDLEKTVRDLLKEYDKQEDTKIRSLVKMYENMKPKDAARIFDEMEMPVLLTLVDKMSERKAAPILANMLPTKAKELTMDLANDRRLRTDKEVELNNLSAPR
jgi:flagellar motility protein MotE (MotC chaperone)